MRPLKQFDIPRAGIDTQKYLHRPASDDDYDILFRENCRVNLEGRPPIIYIANSTEKMDELVPHLQALKYSVSKRKGLGKGNKSILVGAVPANINKSNYCTYGAVANQNDLLHQLLTDKVSYYLQGLMECYLPLWSKVWRVIFERKKIHSDYHMSNSIWTSAIININSPHNYHYDTLNVSKMTSAMITFKNNVQGGYLCFPEYRIAFEVKDRSVIFFSGKHILHGVTPMVLEEGGNRISLVYYTTQSLTKCRSQKEEVMKAMQK